MRAPDLHRARSRLRLREIGERVGITERPRTASSPSCSPRGYITRTRNGRRNRYTINRDLPLPDPLARDQNVGDLLTALTTTGATPPPREHSNDLGPRGT